MAISTSWRAVMDRDGAALTKDSRTLIQQETYRTFKIWHQSEPTKSNLSADDVDSLLSEWEIDPGQGWH